MKGARIHQVDNVSDSMEKAEKKNEMHLINEVSRFVNLSQKRIREYEKEGFIKPLRAPHTNNRLYTDFDILQIKHINRLIHENGFTLACLRNLLVLAPCWNIFDCKKKEECPAYHSPKARCYDVRSNESGTLCPGPCEQCAVYINRNVKRVKVLEKV
jgi:MerR family transcriptional regulator, repressor of the yfmOP operon